MKKMQLQKLSGLAIPAIVAAMVCGFGGITSAKADAKETSHAFAFILPAGESVRFQHAAQIIVSIMPVDPKTRKPVCRRFELSQKNKRFEFWADQSAPPSNIVVWNGVVLRALRCDVGGVNALQPTLYVTGTTIDATDPPIR